VLVASDIAGACSFCNNARVVGEPDGAVALIAQRDLAPQEPGIYYMLATSYSLLDTSYSLLATSY